MLKLTLMTQPAQGAQSKLPLYLITKVITLLSRCATTAVVDTRKLAAKMLEIAVRLVKKFPQKIPLLMFSAYNLPTSLPSIKQL